MQVEFTDDAVLDIEEAVLWYENKRSGLSLDFELCLDAGIDNIIQNPNAYPVRYKHVSVHFIKRFPYGIHFYLPDEYTIRVIGVIHTSRSPAIWF